MTTYHDIHTPELLDAHIQQLKTMLLTVIDLLREKIDNEQHGTHLILDIQQFNFFQREYRQALDEKARRDTEANTASRKEILEVPQGRTVDEYQAERHKNALDLNLIPIHPNGQNDLYIYGQVPIDLSKSGKSQLHIMRTIAEQLDTKLTSARNALNAIVGESESAEDFIAVALTGLNHSR